MLLEDGREIPADLVVMAVGIRPNTGLAKAAGLAVERGIVVDDDMRTSDPAIYAVGECVEHRGSATAWWRRSGTWRSVCADQLTGEVDAAYAGSVTSTRLKVTGIDVFSAGDFTRRRGLRGHRVPRRRAAASTSASSCKDDRIAGAVLYGDAADGAWYFELLREAETSPTSATR